MFTPVNQSDLCGVNLSFTMMRHHHFTAGSPIFGAFGGKEQCRRGEVIAVLSKGL
jgi:hypothetical protein